MPKEPATGAGPDGLNAGGRFSLFVDETTMILRMLLASALGLLVGFERERHGRAAGLRTCMLVAMAGALLMSLSLHLAHLF